MTFLLMQVTELPIKIRMIVRNRPFSGHNRRFDPSWCRWKGLRRV